METDEKLDNTDNMSKNAAKLQEDLCRLKLQIIKAKAQLKAEQKANTTTNNLVDDDGDLYGPDADKASEELHRITRERTQTFLNFTNLQLALRASQANKAITRAFNLERDGKISLEKEEEDHVRSLLEDQKELTVEVIKQHEEGVEQELKIIEARLELAQLYTRYKDIIGTVVDKRRSVGADSWEQDTVKMHEAVKKGDQKINQMRFMIQKFMLSFNKFGLQFEDEALNARYKALLLRCGKSPEEMRRILSEEATQDEEMVMAPAAAGDLHN